MRTAAEHAQIVRNVAATCAVALDMAHAALVDCDFLFEDAVDLLCQRGTDVAAVTKPNVPVYAEDVHMVSSLCGVPLLEAAAAVSKCGNVDDAVDALCAGQIEFTKCSPHGSDNATLMEPSEDIIMGSHLSEAGTASAGCGPQVPRGSSGPRTWTAGRRSQQSIIASATLAVTQELVETRLSMPCTSHCFSRAVDTLVAQGRRRDRAIRKIAREIADLRDDIADSRAELLLLQMNDLWTHATDIDKSVEVAKRSSQMSYHLPGVHNCTFCLNCWGLATDSAKLLPDGKVTRSTLLSRVVAAFNRGEKNVANLYSTGTPAEMKAPQTFDTFFESQVHVWLKMWLPGNVDVSPMLPDKMHLDAPSRTFVYQIMRAEWIERGRRVPEVALFLRVLRKNFKIVIHKHKKFAECEVCSLYKELWAKSRHESCTLRTEIRLLRAGHLRQQYDERWEYYVAREMSWSDPENFLCCMADCMTETSTSIPMQRRSSKGFGHVKFKTALFGVLVHGPEGFYAYTMNGLKGGRTTCEVIHRTLLKLKQTRKVWPRNLLLQLDNTCSDNKNHTVFAYCAWLVSQGVFETVEVRFLLVGHTHEDIDGYFGILRRHLWRQEKGTSI